LIALQVRKTHSKFQLVINPKVLAGNLSNDAWGVTLGSIAVVNSTFRHESAVARDKLLS
jgi:hypothetical protein